MSKRLKDPRTFVFLLPFLVLAPVWARGQALYWGTPSTQFVPWWVQAWESIAQGELPLWNPMLGMGTPLLANYQSALFYPGTWIYFLLYRLGGTPLMAWGIAPTVALHLALAAAGMLRLLREFALSSFAQMLGAMAFSLSGYLVARAHFLSINTTLAWLPWILWANYHLVKTGSKKAILQLTILLSLQWLAGHAQSAWYSLLLMGIWTIYWIARPVNRNRWWRLLAQFALAMSLAFAISAIQLIPTLEFLLHSQRASQVDIAVVMNYSFWPWRLLTLILPNFFGNPAQGNFWGYGNYWEDAIYVGLLPIILAVIWLLHRGKSKQEKSLAIFLGFLGGLGLLLALGRNAPLFPWLYAHMPSFDLFQAPTRFNIWLVWALAMLAAFAAETWRRPTGQALYWSRLAVAGALAILLIAVLGEDIARQFGLLIEESFLASLLPLAVFSLLLTLLNLIAPLRAERSFSFWHWGIIGLLTVDLIWAGWRLNPGVERSFYAENSANVAVAQLLKTDERSYIFREYEDELKFENFFRFDTFESNLPLENMRSYSLPNIGLLDEIASANNFDPILVARYAEFIGALESQAADRQLAFLGAANVGAVLRIDELSGVSFEYIEGWGLIQWANCAQVVNGRAMASHKLKENGPLRDEIIVEIPNSSPERICGGRPGVEAEVEVQARSNNALFLLVDAPSGAWLLMADTYYPGWQAYLDGDRIEMYPANLAFRAIQVPQGEHFLSLHYRPISFYIGAGMTGAGLIFWLLSVRKTRREQAA